MEQQKGVENLLELIEPNETCVLQNLEERFNKKRIYTNVGNLLISINPFEQFPIYDDSVIKQYHDINSAAHIFSTARQALNNIQNGSTSENVIFSGESGSGKSFNSRQVLNYLCSMDNSRVTRKHVDSIQRVINSFTCAKTAKNDVSTRFGYSTELHYRKGQLSGFGLKINSPLETMRTISQKPGERNFNVFYELLRGTPTEKKIAVGIKDTQKFFYLSQSKVCETTDDDDAKNLQSLDESLMILGFTEEQRQLVYRVLFAILHIGNVFFRLRKAGENLPDTIEVGNETELKWASFLLEADYSSLLSSFVTKTIKLEDEVKQSSYTMEQALDNRDAIAEVLYEELFHWIINKISNNFKCSDSDAVITVYDQYGYERYNNNGFEQLLINSVNEKLEHLFVKQVFHDEVVEYLKEGISFDWEIPSHLDNNKTIDLIFKKPYGLLHLLDDECKFPKASDETYVQHCNLNHLDKNVYGKARSKDRQEFSVRHIVGNTWYTAHDFLRKNRRCVPNNIVKTLSDSQNMVVSMLFRSILSGNSDYISYAAHKFAYSTHVLTEKMANISSHYVRCVRSNNERQANKFDLPTVSRQLRSLAIMEIMQFRLVGYPVKMTFKKFAQSFRCLLPSDIAACQKENEIIEDVLDGQGVKFYHQYKIGSNNVFLREQLANHLHSKRDKTRKTASLVVQKTLRTNVARRKYLKKRNAVIKLQAGFRGWKARKDYEAQREQIFKSIGKETKRNKRLDAYHSVLNNSSKKEIPSLNFEPTEKDAALSGNKEKNNNDFKTTQEYLPIPLKKSAINIKPIPLEQFAQTHFKGHLLGVRREQILSPFLHKETDHDFQLATEIFKLVMKYMNDSNLSDNQLRELSKFIVKQGIVNKCQRDEILVQICNQTYQNRDKKASDRGWTLLIQALSAFPASQVFIPTLISFIESAPSSTKSYLQEIICRRMKINNPQVTRLLPSSRLEIWASEAGKQNSAFAISCCDGQEFMVETHSWITNEEIVNRVLRHRGVGDSTGWSIEIEADDVLFNPSGAHFFHDLLAELEEKSDTRSLFYHYPSEKTLPPMNKKKVEPKLPPPLPETNKIMSPVEKRRARMVSGANPAERTTSMRRERSADAIRDLPRTKERRERSFDATHERVPSYQEDELVYSYTLPNKSQSGQIERVTSPLNRIPPTDTIRKRSESPIRRRNNSEKDLLNQTNRSLDRTYETNNDAQQSQSRMINNSQVNYDNGMMQQFAYAPNHMTPMNQMNQMPIVQYMPVLMHPNQQMMTPMMMPQTIMNPGMIPQNMTYQYNEMPQTYSQPMPYRQNEGHFVPNKPWKSQNLAQNEGEKYIDDEREQYDIDEQRQVESRSQRPPGSRCERVPSEYSTMSVASRIRRMPVPENTRDVDRFLDEVFDQVLSPEEMRSAESGVRQIAGSIKGGKAPVYDIEAPYNVSPNQYQPAGEFYQDDNNGYGNHVNNRQPSRQNEYGNYHNDIQYSNGHYHAQKPPPSQFSRKELMRTAVPPESSHLSYDYDERVPSRPMGYGLTQKDNGPYMPAMMATPQHLAPNERGRYPSGSAPHMSYQHPMAFRQSDGSTETSDDSYTPEGTVEDCYPMNQPYPASSYIHNPAFSHQRNMRTANIPRIDNDIPRVGQPKVPPLQSPVSPPPQFAKQGLNRVPIDRYAEPVIQNQVTNAEHMVPNRLINPEKDLIAEMKRKERDALMRISEKMKKLPPPVDEVKIYIPIKKPLPPIEIPSPKPPPPREPSPPPPPKPIIVPPPPKPVHVEPPRNEWVFEGDVDRPIDSQGRTVVDGKDEYSFVTPSPTPVPVNKPVAKYNKQPWKLTIRKEMFLPNEPLEDIIIIDQVFAQIINDCRRAIAYRIRTYEREDVVSILRRYNVPPELLNRQNEIPTDIKVAVIEAARLWPLYFSQITEVVEERADESIAILLSIGEHGVRLLLHTPLDKENPLKVQDHFNYADIAETSLESDDLVCIHLRNRMVVRIRTRMAPQIKKQIDKCLSGEVKYKQFVKATTDYVTREPNLLSFKKGDTIELVSRPEGELIPSGAWLYGKIGNKFGNLPAQYIVPIDEFSDIESVPPLPMLNDGDSIFNGDFSEDEFAGDKYTMLEFAMKYFRGPKGFDGSAGRRNKKEWTWQDVAQKVKFTDKPITHSLLKLEGNENDKLACETFLCIMKYMMDEPLKRGVSQTDNVYRLLLIGNKNPILKDEIYCQIVRQTTNNKSNKSESHLRGWRLFSILTAYFECSLALKPYLLRYLAENADDPRRAYHGTAQLCLQNLRQTLRYGGRKLLLSGMELEEITSGKILKRQSYFYPGGHQKVVNTKSVTVVEEIIQELCADMNVGSPSEQQEFSLCYVTKKDNEIHFCGNDEYILDICTELDHKKVAFHLLLRRTVWVHPLRLDNPIYIDVMYFQTREDYLRGALISMQSVGQLSAATTDDVVKLAAFLHFSTDEDRHHAITGRSIANLLPSTVVDARVMSLDSWSNRVNRRIRGMDNGMSYTQARASFLEILSEWPLFGTSVFSLENASLDSRPLPPAELVIGKNGVKLIAPLSHKEIDTFTYDKIISTKAIKRLANNYVEMTVGNMDSNQIYEFRSIEAESIARLIGQYIFVTSENKGFLDE